MTTDRRDQIRRALLAAEVDPEIADTAAASVAAQMADRQLVRDLFGEPSKPDAIGTDRESIAAALFNPKGTT